MTSDTPRTDAEKVDKGGMTFIWVEFAQQLERELTHSLENQVKAQSEVKEIRSALGDDGRRTHKELLEMAFKASGWKVWKEKYIDLRNAHIAEGQDPAGTIWEHADKLQKELATSKAEVKIFRKEIIFREAMDNVAQEVWDEMKAEVEELKQQKRNCLEIIDDDAKERSELKAEVERLTELLSLEERQHEETRKLCAKILNSTRTTPSLEWHRKNRKVLLK